MVIQKWYYDIHLLCLRSGDDVTSKRKALWALAIVMWACEKYPRWN